ncbi:MarR family winged helix-turn-helix transcriptional regulator [Streptomyces sp. NPDC059788]|uniref:MarR family winged helix-turn-helix transcriptional regulator n=1 Tax=Streptomyces sp. NPDC059788 TaxID=3346948 RepID=UPI0036627118
MTEPAPDDNARTQQTEQPGRTPDEQTEIFRRYLDAVGLHGMAGAEAVGLGGSEWYALSQIALEGALSSGELSARTGLTTGATTRLIDRLERSGYVRRAADPADRRKVIVEPVAGAFDRIEKVVEPARRQIAEVLARYTPDQLDVLFDYFARAAPAYRAATQEIREGTTQRHRRQQGGS